MNKKKKKKEKKTNHTKEEIKYIGFKKRRLLLTNQSEVIRRL